jgi:hypothetical protein
VYLRGWSIFSSCSSVKRPLNKAFSCLKVARCMLVSCWWGVPSKCRASRSINHVWTSLAHAHSSQQTRAVRRKYKNATHHFFKGLGISSWFSNERWNGCVQLVQLPSFVDFDFLGTSQTKPINHKLETMAKAGTMNREIVSLPCSSHFLTNFYTIFFLSCAIHL